MARIRDNVAVIARVQWRKALADHTLILEQSLEDWPQLHVGKGVAELSISKIFASKPRKKAFSIGPHRHFLMTICPRS